MFRRGCITLSLVFWIVIAVTASRCLEVCGAHDSLRASQIWLWIEIDALVKIFEVDMVRVKRVWVVVVALWSLQLRMEMRLGAACW